MVSDHSLTHLSQNLRDYPIDLGEILILPQDPPIGSCLFLDVLSYYSLFIVLHINKNYNICIPEERQKTVFLYTYFVIMSFLIAYQPDVLVILESFFSLCYT